MDPNVPATADEIQYPDSDGKPMADNTLQWDWIVKIVGEVRTMLAGRQVFIAGDLLWYPVWGKAISMAPDALVAFGRPPGYRGSYKQWEEGGIAPQVVFEVLSPSNTPEEMADKLMKYDKYGVQEYYVVDPYEHHLEGYLRRDGRLEPVPQMRGHISPALGIRFEIRDEVKIYTPEGHEFQVYEHRVQELLEEQRKTAQAFEDERARAIQAEKELLLEQEKAAKAEEEAKLQQETAERERKRATRAEEQAKLQQEKVTRERKRATRAEEQAKLQQEKAEREQKRAVEAERLAKLQQEKAEQEHKLVEQERAMKDVLIAKLRELGVNPDDLLKPAG